MKTVFSIICLLSVLVSCKPTQPTDYYTKDDWEYINYLPITNYGNFSYITVNDNNDIFISNTSSLLKSSDSGKNWIEVLTYQQVGYVTQLIQNPVTKSMFAGFNRHENYSSPAEYGILKSTDNGSTWQIIKSDSLPKNVSNYSLVVTKKGNLFASVYLPYFKNNDTTTYFVSAVYCSTDDGTSWKIKKSDFDSLPGYLYTNDKYLMLVKNPKNTKCNIFTSTDEGNTWSNHILDNYSDTYVYPGNNEDVYLMNFSAYKASFTNPVKKPINGISFGALGCGFFLSNTGNQYIFNMSGLYLSKDNGYSWRNLMKSQDDNNNSICESNDGYIYTITGSNTIFRSKKAFAKM